MRYTSTLKHLVGFLLLIFISFTFLQFYRHDRESWITRVLLAIGAEEFIQLFGVIYRVTHEEGL
ncbi:MAG: hypothetical protein LM589_02365 [Thermosphaera sp.]|nr:hypothetical protein [Thermosphaera sp.]